MLANYLPMCMEQAGRLWLQSLPEKSISSWGDLTKKFVENFQATCEKPGNYFDLNRLKQKHVETLIDFIRHFCNKKALIPNVLD